MMHGSMKGFCLGFLSIVVFVSAGCAGLGKRLEPPRAHVANIQVQEVRGLETVFQIELRLFNTNDVPIDIKGLECELEINDRHFASGLSDKPTKIPPYGTGIIPVVLYSSVLDMLKGVWELQDKQRLAYKMRGRLHLGSGSLVPSAIPFESDGELSLETIIKARPGG